MIKFLSKKPLQRLAVRQFFNSPAQFAKKDFFKNHDAFNHDNIKSIVGETIDNAIDVTKVRPGEIIDVPYEITISHSLRDFWQSAFYSHDRLNTSTPFARELNLQDQVLPFHLMLFLAGSMSHADHAKLQTGFKNAKYLFPGFAGDTFKKRFIIRSLRSTSDGRNSIIKIDCEIRNQRGVVVFVCEKTMLFPFKVPPSDVVVTPAEEDRPESFLNHLIQQTEKLQNMGSQTLTSLRPGQLIVHTLTRPLSETHMMQLATLGRLTHERHFNTRKYRRYVIYREYNTYNIMSIHVLIYTLTCVVTDIERSCWCRVDSCWDSLRRLLAETCMRFVYIVLLYICLSVYLYASYEIYSYFNDD